MTKDKKPKLTANETIQSEVPDARFYYISEAAQLLAKATKDSENTKIFLLQALEGNIKLYWRLENRLARRVEPTSKMGEPFLLPYRFLSPESRAFKKLKVGSVIAQATSWGDKSKVLFVGNEPNVTHKTMPYMAYRAVEKKAHTIKGIAALAFDDRNLVMKEWLHSQVTGVNRQVMSYDGVIISRSDGLWQLVDKVNDKLCGIPLDFPEMNEVLIHEEDLEKVAQQFTDEPIEKPVLGIEKSSYENVIGALLALSCKGTRNSLLKSKIISQEAYETLSKGRYMTEDQVIMAIREAFPNTLGLKKSNLQNKFRDGKTKLGLPDDGNEEE